MKIFIDTASIEEIEQAKGYGILDGVTTNPSLLKEAADARRKEGHDIDIEGYIRRILHVCKGKPVSLEVIGGDADRIVRQARILLRKFNRNKNVVIKIPVNPSMREDDGMSFEGIKAVKTLSDSGIRVNVTLVMNATQALLAAKAGAAYVSPFVGRIDDRLRTQAGMKFEKRDYYPQEGKEKNGTLVADDGIVSGVRLIRSIRTIFDNACFKTEILAASLRNPRQVREVAEMGADVATLPFSVLRELVEHPKTLEGMQRFTKDAPDAYKTLLK